MPSQAHLDPHIILVVLALVGTWYLYQITSRKKERLRYSLKWLGVAEVCYLGAATILGRQHLAPLESIVFAMLVGVGCAELLVRRPRRDRRIPKPIRQQVIARDLTSKGLKWDSTKYHLDHVVPFSRGGDHSVRNIRVLEKERNIRKGNRMPKLWDFLRR